MASTLSDRLRQAARGLARRPLYAALGIVTVGIGVAASTAAFTLVHAAFLEPLPYPEASRLVTVDVTSAQGYGISMSVPNYRDWSGRTRVFERTGGFSFWGVVLSGQGPARIVRASRILGDFFGTVGVETQLGRVFTAQETERGEAPTVVLSHAFWQELGADPGLLGRALLFDDRPYTVIGVLPPGVGFPSPETAAYLPLGANTERLPWNDRESSFGMRMVARLRPGVSLAAARRDLDRVTAEIRDEEGHAVATAGARSLSDYLVGRLEAPLTMLAVAAALLVALALANVVGLFLARGEGRRPELAVRTALGAPGSDLVQLHLAEGVWLVGAGAVVGLGGARSILALLAAAAPERVPHFVLDRLMIDGAALAFVAVLVTAILAATALVPAWLLPRGDASEALHGTRAGGSRRSLRLRSALVIGELALGAMLLVGSALLISSLDRLRHVDKGFDERGVVTARIVPPARYFEQRAAWLEFHREVLTRARALPGVRSAALSLLVPLSDMSWEMSIYPEGQAVDRDHASSVLFNVVSPDYFATLGMPLARGRAFTAVDRNGAEPVAIIDRSMADRFWPGEDPIGQRVAIGFDFDPDSNEAPVYRTVVGVVGNVRHYELQNPARIEVYLPVAQLGERFDMSLALLARTSGELTPLLREIPGLVAGIDPAVPTLSPAPLADNVEAAVAVPRLLGGTISALGALAVLLAGVGAFALAAHGVSSRSREFGVRQALGATPGQILAGVMRRGVAWSGAALAIGLPLAAVGARLARSLLFGVGALEPSAYVAAAGTLSVLVALACLGPGLRAMRMHPARVLRDDT